MNDQAKRKQGKKKGHIEQEVEYCLVEVVGQIGHGCQVLQHCRMTTNADSIWLEGIHM